MFQRFTRGVRGLGFTFPAVTSEDAFRTPGLGVVGLCPAIARWVWDLGFRAPKQPY